ncbi:MAG TPA: NAD(P)-binding domain-containing protein, partial [Bacteroidia bacterium]|nr:NAD(P)-binding domain-containing protein [Bacteroidia bacterium]
METPQPYFKIVIIGAGNVATHLANRLKKKGHDILQIVSRSAENAKVLSLQIGVPFVTDIKKINK